MSRHEQTLEKDDATAASLSVVDEPASVCRGLSLGASVISGCRFANCTVVDVEDVVTVVVRTFDMVCVVVVTG